jgi:hypothetical protein
MLLPRLGDHILATEGYNGQMTSEPTRRDRPDNLFQPVQGDYGSHGRFDDRAVGKVIGFNPTWLKAGIVCTLAVMASIATFGRSCRERDERAKRHALR